MVATTRGQTKPRRRWLRVFWTGLALWAASVVVTVATANTNLLPTVVLLGSFLVPVTFVVWAYEHGRAGEITVPLLFSAFVIGGVLGVLGASVLETYLLHPSLWMYFGVGLIEEGVKLLALMFVARHVHPRTTRDGLVLGATVGFGFASFESSGYALNSLFTTQGISVRSMVETEILRGVLAPLGHGLWTSILGGVLFAVAGRRWRITGGLLLAYLGVALLHALWDSMHGIAIGLSLFLTGTPWQYELLERGYLPRATDTQGHLITLINWLGLIVISIIALSWLRAEATHSRRAEPPTPPEAPRPPERTTPTPGPPGHP
ncbi:PrsW family intramembrane metalloprotease [Spirillospora sp. NBC_01491]|uniref:PrsW family intramembrane metalloprotease n=1 Tax=Spirillospora sp. NBC_01491 TaxID=2976007 RepID=UPI002E35718D|nr:PrsW family intramembrane metalloprotease [Spirillospora sp. NBC_01491]